MGGEKGGLSYSATGVDIDVEKRVVKTLISRLGAGRRKGKKDVPGGFFTGLVDFGDYYLSLCTDGVGSKVLVASAMQKWDTVGIDCIAMNVNDMICAGARPIAFVDYLAVEKHDLRFAEEIGRGLARGAEMAGVRIIGGETATLPEIVRGFDLAGTCLGAVRKDRVITGEKVSPGDVLVGLQSSGLHSNGYTLARKIVEKKGGFHSPFPADPTKSWGEVLLEPTRIYVKPVLAVVERYDVHGLAHITGGGLENIPRMNPSHGYEITDPFTPQPVFIELQRLGGVSDQEMYRVFNMGMGFVLAVSPEEADNVVGTLRDMGENAKVVGRVVDGGEKGGWVRHVPLGLEYRL